VVHVFSATLLIGALVLSAFLIVDGVTDLWLREAEPERAQEPSPAPHTEELESQHKQPRSDLTEVPREPTATVVTQREVAESHAPAIDQPALPSWCDAGVRLAGSAYVRPGVGKPLVMFSGPDVRRRGLRSVGGRVAGKTVVAIHPDAVVLRDADGRDCWLKMSSEHARKVLDTERTAHARHMVDVQREKQREERRKRAAQRRAAKSGKR
jgi:hypothetical protein